MMMKISAVHAWEALDSRGRPTVGCRIALESGASGRAISPSGASAGGYEAHELRDGGERYGGLGVRQAVDNLTRIAPALIGRSVDDQEELDAWLEELDPDPALGTIGANAVLAVSLAAMRARADELRLPLWQTWSGSEAPLLPMPMINIVSGGAHAAGALDIQDVLVIPVASTSFAEAIEWVSRVRAATAAELSAAGHTAALVADEGGLAAALGSNEAALTLVRDGIVRAGFEPAAEVAMAVDFAANQLVRNGRYRLAAEDVDHSVEEWVATVHGWCSEFDLVSVEDVVHEDDWESWSSFAARESGQRQVLGDDLFATNLDRLRRGVGVEAANAVLIKVNQAGTVSRARRVLERAKQAGWRTVVSARSGDTEDDWLADLAVGWEAGQIKVGSTMRSERTAKWNRLLEIESAAAGASRFAGWPQTGSPVL